MSRDEIITIRVTKEERELLSELKELMYEENLIETDAMSSFVRTLAIERCEQIVGSMEEQ